jgi:hypothetical protein
MCLLGADYFCSAKDFWFSGEPLADHWADIDLPLRSVQLSLLSAGIREIG